MKLLTVLGVTLTATFTFGMMATSALVLPDISIALGGSYPLRGQLVDNGKTQVKLETTAGRKLEGKGLALSGSIEELSASGKAELEILGVAMGETVCHSQGDKEGEVLVKDTLALVPVRLAPLENRDTPYGPGS